ncbi:glycosyltransferase family 61 protein [Rhodopila sp.]|uniref:glycosyltransferase family 61 protein n=1 Tax=Rhodopila sp. TaxID=2480087 RepID=UPI003D0BFE68
MSGTSEQTSRQSLEAAAAKADELERTCLFHGGSEIALGEALARHPVGPDFHALGATTAVLNHTLENVVLDADSLILFKHGHAIAETVYFEPPGAARQLQEGVELTSLPEGENLIFGYNNAHLGYQHWLTQCLPAIDWSLRGKRAGNARLILPRLAPWQEETLAALGLDRIPRLTPQANTRYHLPRVEYSDFLTGATSFAICMSGLQTAKRLADAMPSYPTHDKVLYIDEVNPYYGSIRNEGAVIDLLRRRGVTIVERERLSTAERINLFRHADAIIGPLGQGLTDVLFCRPGTLMWEWMPGHHQNSSFNRLAQATQVDYWADMFATVAEPSKPGQWEIDLDLVEQRLKLLSSRLAHRAAAVATTADASPVVTRSISSRPVRELMQSFESLGDNCEFGLVQQQAGVTSAGLLRFNGFFAPPEFRLEKLVAALQRKFDGLGAQGTISVLPEGEPGHRELIVRETAYGMLYHSGVREGQIDPEAQIERAAKLLGHLRERLLENLATGQKIWVWKSQCKTSREDIQPLLETLREMGPNTLLWVAEADDDHPAGSIERLEADLIKGYVDHFAPYGSVANIHSASWFEVCWRADECCRPDRAGREPGPEADYQPERPPPPLTAMEILARNPAPTPVAAPRVTPRAASRSGIWRWVRRP